MSIVPDGEEQSANLRSIVALIVASDLFVDAHYARLAQVTGTRPTLAAHYLTMGEPALVTPSTAFDPRYYLETYLDVAETGGSPLLHYIQHGRAEHRYATREALRADARRVAASGLFDTRVYAWNRGRRAMPGLSDIEDYLLGRDSGVAIGDGFDSAFYARVYGDFGATHALPLLHYIDVGRAELRVVDGHDLFRRVESGRGRFHERYYLGQFPRGQGPEKPLEHYILEGSRMGLDPAPDFSADYYLAAYPDLRTAGMDPFYHFAAFGKAEGRSGRPDFSAILKDGDIAFDLTKPTVLVASHEASRTGAPLVGLNVGARLAATHNVISYVGRAGPLSPDFAAHSVLTVTASLGPLDAEFLMRQLAASHRLSAVLLNSIETSPLALGALQAGLPSVALIHEFAEYTLPIGRMSDALECVDRVITPAALIQDSLQAELVRTRSNPANHIVVRPQGFLPTLPEEGAELDLTRDEILAFIGIDAPEAETGRAGPRIVLGAGFVHMRKGVDLFVQTAAAVCKLAGDDVRFVWVGAGYAPEADLAYSAWVADMVRRLDLERHMFFLPAQSSLDVLFGLADVFYLPSRLDPFPNVVLDAFRAGRAVVCFDRATGVAGVLKDEPGRKSAVGAAVPYLDVAAAAAALVAAWAPGQAKSAAGNVALAARLFDFDDYMAFVGEQLTLAAELRAEAARAAQAIEASGLFDAAFHSNLPGLVSPRMLRGAVREYVARGQKGLLRYNPCPGFNEGVARSRLTRPGPALDPAGSPATHRCVVLPGTASKAGVRLRTALHIHLHYPELAAEFEAKLSAADGKVDLMLTTTSDAKRLEVEYAFRRYKNGSTMCRVVPNRGRDIGPFLTEVGTLVQAEEYDIIGHMHGKRSLAVEAALGDRWRGYLLDTLLGGAGGLSSVLSLFQQDSALGLLFAEDRHCVGWGKNRPFAAALAARMQPELSLPDWPIFPIGTMFWARPKALTPLWALGLTAKDFPAEPAPYDGTVLHAIERMLPSVCDQTGHGWCTVYRRNTGW